MPCVQTKEEIYDTRQLVSTTDVNTQTENQSSVIDNALDNRQYYQYGSLRRVNSDLLDYIALSDIMK
jgi:hypothetical protein